MVQWIRIHLPAQGTGSNACSGKTPHVEEQLSPCTAAAEPVLQSLRVTTAEARAPRAHALQQRGHRTEEPEHHSDEEALLAATRESPSRTMKTQCSQK